MVFHWSLNDSKSPQVYRTLLSILDHLNNAVVWVVCIRPLISKSPRCYTNPLVTVPSAPITFGITVTSKFQSFFSCLAKPSYLSVFLLSFSFTQWYAGTAKSNMRQVLFLLLLLLLTITRSGCLVEIRRSFCIPNSQRTLCVSFSRSDSGLCLYRLFV